VERDNLRQPIDKAHAQNVRSIARVAAGAFGFFILIQVLDGLERYGAFSFFETIPSRPRLQAAANNLSP